MAKAWKRMVAGPESDRLWKALALSEWPDMTKALLDAGALDRTTFRDFYLRRKRPAVTKAPSIAREEDELFVLIDMPNLVKANTDGTESGMPPQPMHRVFPLVSALRMIGTRHQDIFYETTCSCGPNNCTHPSGWLHFPLADEVFRPNMKTVNRLSFINEVLRLDVSILRKSDGKVVKVLKSTSSRCRIQVVDGLDEGTAVYNHEYGRPPNHVAGLRFDESDAVVAFDEQKFTLRHIVLGLAVCGPIECTTSVTPRIRWACQ